MEEKNTTTQNGESAKQLPKREELASIKINEINLHIIAEKKPDA